MPQIPLIFQIMISVRLKAVHTAQDPFNFDADPDPDPNPDPDPGHFFKIY